MRIKDIIKKKKKKRDPMETTSLRISVEMNNRLGKVAEELCVGKGLLIKTAVETALNKWEKDIKAEL